VKITRLETIPVRIPINPERAIRGGGGVHLVSPFLLVKVHTDDGLIGLGEVSCTPNWSGEDQVTAAHVIRTYLEPGLIGTDPTEVERVSRIMRKSVAGNPFTRAGLEMACWDLLGKVANLPLYRLLGGKVRARVPTKFSVSGLEPDSAARIAEWAVQQGFTAMKVKVGIEPESDIARVAAVREAVGPRVRLGIDANGGWSPRVAIQTINRLADYDIWFAEQPVPPQDVAWLAEVRRHVSVPVLADESVFRLEDAMSVVREYAADAISMYIGKGGGIGPALKIASVAEAAGLGCTIGSNLEMDIAMAAMIHVGLSTTGVDAEGLPCDILGPFFYEGDLLTEPLDIRAGSASIGDRPGLGVELDEAKVAHYRVDEP
jgi:L-alanine-DL-glutamate epimerase-like enolase superfamily enzyme